MKRKNFFLKGFLPLAIIFSIVFVWLLYDQKKQFINMVTSREKHLVFHDASGLEVWLERCLEDINQISCYIGHLSGNEINIQDNEQLIDILQIYAKTRKSCRRISYYDNNKIEKIRLDIVNSRPYIHTSDIQQDNIVDNLVKNKISSNGIYVSSLYPDSLIGGKIHERVPVLFIINKVCDPKTSDEGYVVVAYSLSMVLRTLTDISEDSYGDLFIVDSNGGIVSGGIDKFSWEANSLKDKSSIQDLFPAIWELISDKDIGQIHTSKGIFTFIKPDYSEYPVIFDSPIIFQDKWRILSYVPADKIIIPNVLFIIMVFTILMGWTAFLFWRKYLAIVEIESAKKALELSEKRFRDVSEAAAEFIWETGADGTFTYAAGKAEEIIGYSIEELVGRSPFDFVDAEHDWDIRKEFLDAAQTGKPISGKVFKFKDRDGNTIWLKFNGVPILDGDNQVVGFRGAASDITVQKQALIELKDQEDTLRSISESVQEGIVLLDEKGIVQFWNLAAENILGFSSDEMCGNDLSCCVFPEDNVLDGNLSSEIVNILSDYGDFQVKMRSKNGVVFPAEVLLSPLKKNNSWWVVGTIKDITERKENEEKLKTMAQVDAFTGTFSKNFFLDRLKSSINRSLRYNRPLSFMIIEVDNLDNIAEDYGRNLGGLILNEISTLLLSKIRNVDILGRVGNRKFGLLLPETNREQSLHVAQKVMKAVDELEIGICSINLKVTVSIGLTILNDEICTVEKIFEAAEGALLEAKKSGNGHLGEKIKLD